VERSAEEPGRPYREGAKATNAVREDITVGRPGRESERPIVVGKRGNARGAKGPYWKHVSVRGGEIRLDENPTTEIRAVAAKAMPEKAKEQDCRRKFLN
jgi:hypothetical protein